MADTITGPVNGRATKSNLLKLPLQPPAVPDDDGQALEDERPVPVDPPALAAPGITSEARRPIVPAWLRTRAGVTATVRHTGSRMLYATGYHALRTPLYAAQLAAYAPRGGMRLVVSTGRWVWDREAAPLRAAAVGRDDVDEYMRLTAQRDRRVRTRGTVALVAVVFGAGLALTLYVMAPTWLALFGAASVMVAGFLGQEQDHPVIGPAVVKTEVQKLTSSVVLRALGAIGNDKINRALGKGGEGIRFTAEITRDGPGYRADLDLPYGVAAADIMEKRRSLSSGLRRPLGCVWPEGDPGQHEGRLILWVGDKDLSAQAKITWPLARSGQHDYFNPVPFGSDPRGRALAVPLFQHNVLIGSLPGQGKTASVRVLVSGASLDPTAELWLHENKGTGDLEAFERVSHRYVSGIEDEAIEYAADSLALLRKEVMRRSAALKAIPAELRPDKRVTRQIANMRQVRLHPLVGVFDECQNLFAHKEFGEQAGEDAEFVIKLGRALGVTLILATQRPDKASLPTGVSGNVSIRFCLRVAGQVENDMILGTSAYKNGYRATTFRPEVDAGIGYLGGASAIPLVVRTAYVDGPASERIAQRAYALRKAAGTLTGHAAAEAPERTTPSFDILADVLTVVPASEEKVWGERIASRLAELRPDVYGGWKGENVTSSLKPHGIGAQDVWGTTDAGKGTTRRGFARTDILAAVTRRDGKKSAD